MLSRCLTLITKNYDRVLEGTANLSPDLTLLHSYSPIKSTDDGKPVGIDHGYSVHQIQKYVEGCNYNIALTHVVFTYLTPTNQYLEANAPWKLVKTDKEAAKRVLFNAVQSLRIAAILLKPFIPKSAETIYKSFNFPTPWEDVKYADAAELKPQTEDLRVTAELIDGKVKPLFPRIG